MKRTYVSLKVYRGTHHPGKAAIRRTGTAEVLSAIGPVAIELPARPPSDEWTCGTRWVWTVPADEVERIGGRRAPQDQVYAVCEHMIELD